MSDAQRVQKLKQLLAIGVITQAEFNARVGGIHACAYVHHPCDKLYRTTTSKDTQGKGDG